MRKFKNICRDTLSYIASRKLLKYFIVALIVFLPTGAILTNKFFNSKKVEINQQVSNKNDKKKNVTQGIITTDVKEEKNISRHTLSDGFTDISENNTSNDSSGNNKTNNVSNPSSIVDKSSLSGINLEISEGNEFNPRKDLKLQATDKDGSNISDNIIIEKNTVNTKIPGIYTVRASIRLSDGQQKEKEFTVTVKETSLDVSLESFKASKENVKKGEQIVFDLDLKVSKNHITPTSAMINGKEYTLYKGDENIFDKLSNKKRYKVIINANDNSGLQKHNLEHVKMSNGSWISLGENIANIEVLKQEAIVKGFTHEEQRLNKRIEVKFSIDDIENTASNLRLEFYKGNELLESKKIDKTLNYNMYLPTISNGNYELKIFADINLNQNVTESNTIFNKVIFSTTMNISNIDQSSIVGEDIEILQGENFDPVKNLSLKATDFDGEDITDKIVVESNNVDTNVVGKYNVSVSVLNKNGQKYTKQLYVTVNPIAKVLEFNPTKDKITLDENISFELKLQMEKDNVEADKAVINGQEVNLVPNKFKNILGNTKTYSVEISGESSDGNKTYSLSKIIMKDGKAFTLKKDTNINILKSEITIDSQDEPSLARMLFSDNKDNRFINRVSRSNATVSGKDTEHIVHNVNVRGMVNKSDGNAPEGVLTVELPTAMVFAVDRRGDFTPSTYTISNKSSVDISISVSEFRSTNKNGGISIKPIDDDISSLDRSNLHLALVGNKNRYVDLGKTISTSKEILDVKASDSSIIQLLGEAGKGRGKEVDDKGAKGDFTLVFKIKKKN